MNMKAIRSLGLSAALSIALVGTAAAGVINFGTNASNSPTPQNTNLGGSYGFSGGLTAFALVPTGPAWTGSSCTQTSTPSTSAPCLVYKYTSGDPSETGLGLMPNINNEIFYPNGVGLLVSSGYIGGLQIGSVQNGESWQVLGCTGTGPSSACSTVLGQGVGGTSGATVTLTGLTNGGYWGYIVDVPCMNSSNCSGAMTNSDNNIVLMSVTTVPEPGTLALFAAGLLGCMLFLRRRARQN